MKEFVENIIETSINRRLAAHGGWLEVVEASEDEVLVRFRGTCRGCGAIDDTVQNIVAPSLRKELPGVRVSICEDADERLV